MRSIRSRLGACTLSALLAFGCTNASAPCPQASGRVAEGVARFAPPAVACAALPASMALVEPRFVQGPVLADWRTRPAFSNEEGRYRAAIAVDPGASLYGTGETVGPLLRNAAITETWAEQPFRNPSPPGLSPLEYDDDSLSLYQAHPWVLAVRADGSSFGVLADTTYRARIDLTDGIEFSATAALPGPARA